MTGRIWKIFVHTALVLCVSVSFANADIIVSSKDQNDAAAALAVTGNIDSSYSKAKTPLEKWYEWLNDEGLTEGKNENANGPFFISKSRANVNKPTSSKNWISSRNAAFETATLNAKGNLAKAIKTLIETERSLSLLAQGGGDPLPIIKEADEKLSVMDKAMALTDKALDQEIKKYDPGWDGTGKSKEERDQKRVELQDSFAKNIAAQARRFISGSLVAKIIEGPNKKGIYEVLVGVVWSPALGRVAAAMYDEGVHLAPTKPSKPIRVQIAKMVADNPHLLATTEGVFVRRNEKGEKVLISFAAVPMSRSSTLNENKSRLNATSYIAQFISEAVVSNQATSGGQILQVYEDGSTAVFDNEMFKEQITATSKKVAISGLVRLFQWDGEHPHSNQSIFVGVYVWSPTTQAVAKQAAKNSRDQEENLRNIGSDGVKQNIGSDGVKQQSGSSDNSAADPAASTVHEGFESDTDDF